MIVKDIFSDTIPALSEKDSTQRALHFMEFFKTYHLPIIKDELFVGMVYDESIIDADNGSSQLMDMPLLLNEAFVFEDEHVYNAVLKMSQNKLSLLAVVDRDRKYLGTISPLDLVSAITKTSSLDQPGSIIVLKMGIRDYSLSEIAQIAESNQIKIMSSYIQTCKDQLNIRLTLKLNSNDLTSIKSSFERYNYTIESIFEENHVLDDRHKNRLDELLHYLDL